MPLAIKSATPPPMMPKKIWLNATEEKRAPSRARSPSDAEEKIKKPPTTSNSTMPSSVRSMLLRMMRLYQILLFCFALCCNRYRHTDNRADDADDPVPHRDFVPRPPERLKVMMERRDAEDFPFPKLFRDDLYDIRKDGGDQRKTDNRQYRDAVPGAEVVGHKHDDGERERERHGAGLRHPKARRRNVKPQKCEYRARDGRTERREVELLLGKRNDGVGGKNGSEHAAA